MNNQWGRSGNGTTASGGSGLAGILFASIVSLALGGAAGYGAFRAMDGAASSSEIDARDKRIAELARELDARAAQIAESSRQAEAAAQENGTLKRQIETLRDDAGTSDTTIVAAENARLTKDVVPGLKKALEQATQRTADAEARRKRAEEAAQDRERQLSLVTDQIARLEKALDQARGQQDSAQSAETERLEAEAATLRRQLEDARRAELAMRTKDLPALRDALASKEREVAALAARNASLAARIDTLEAAARAQPKAPEDGGEGPARGNAPDGRNPRNASEVTQAMRDTPGLDRLTSVQRDQLERALVSGECVTNALGGVFKRVPVLTLRNLMRGLDSDC